METYQAERNNKKKTEKGDLLHGADVAVGLRPNLDERGRASSPWRPRQGQFPDFVVAVNIPHWWQWSPRPGRREQPASIAACFRARADKISGIGPMGLPVQNQFGGLQQSPDKHLKSRPRQIQFGYREGFDWAGGLGKIGLLWRHPGFTHLRGGALRREPRALLSPNPAKRLDITANHGARQGVA